MEDRVTRAAPEQDSELIDRWTTWTVNVAALARAAAEFEGSMRALSDGFLRASLELRRSHLATHLIVRGCPEKLAMWIARHMPERWLPAFRTV